MDLKITRERLKNHLHYGKWIYAAAIGLAMALWGIVFSATQPEIPPQYKIEIYILTYAADAQQWESEILQALPADQQEVIINSHAMETVDAAQMYQVLAAWMAARQGDIFIMSRDLYKSFASGGVFISLETPAEETGKPLLESFPIPEGFDLETLRVEYEADDGQGNAYLEKAICGVPLDGVQGLTDILVIPEGLVASVTSYSQNQANALKALQWIMVNKQKASAAPAALATAQPD